MAIITLTTDFGLADGYVGIMKGVILRIAPEARLVDLSHEVPAQDIRRASAVLARAIPYFPDGTVHLAVVDPGVGGSRRALIVAALGSFFVGPDNGLFSEPLADTNARIYAADRPEFWLPAPSHTFHGRDIFAPLAAHLALGRQPEELGTPAGAPVRLPPAPAPRRLPDGSLGGQVVHVDRFGNLITDVPGAWLAGRGWSCRIAGQSIDRLSISYSEAERGALLALVSSAGTLEIAVREGSAAASLGVGTGEPVLLLPA
jgi:hypothetical protein